MPKRGRKPGPRGPYKSDVSDPDMFGGGGIRLRQYRLARGWTVEITAEQTGLSPGTISGIENGGGYSPETLLKLAKAFNATVGQLFDIDRAKAAKPCGRSGTRPTRPTASASSTTPRRGAREEVNTSAFAVTSPRESAQDPHMSTQRASFYGWRVVGAAFLLAVFGWGIGFYGPPVYLHAVREARGFSLPVVSAAVTVHFLFGAFVVANLPKLYRRFGVAAITKAARSVSAWVSSAGRWRPSRGNFSSRRIAGRRAGSRCRLPR